MLHHLLDKKRQEYRLPALAAAVILNEKIMAVEAVGIRKKGDQKPVTRDDLFHLGSCTKAMTATLIARLVEAGHLKWDMTLAEGLPMLANKMQPGYRTVTLRELVHHRGGFPPPEKSWPQGKTFFDMHTLPGTPMQQRLVYAELMLQQKPSAPPGTKEIYSNAGYAILGCIAEQKMQTPWEQLMRQWVFDPLDMHTVGFGAMGKPGAVLQPWQHTKTLFWTVPIDPGPMSDNPPVIAPAGTVHCSIVDWARFVRAHLKGQNGDDTFLAPPTWQTLHTPAFEQEYASGWQCVDRSWAKGKAWTHSGSNGNNYAVVWVAPEVHFAVLVATNVGGSEVSSACDNTVWKIIETFLLEE